MCNACCKLIHSSVHSQSVVIFHSDLMSQVFANVVLSMALDQRQEISSEVQTQQIL